LRRAEDALVLDNSRMTVANQMEWVMNIIRNRINAG
jgi:cytidylate kinase